MVVLRNRLAVKRAFRKPLVAVQLQTYDDVMRVIGPHTTIADDVVVFREDPAPKAVTDWVSGLSLPQPAMSAIGWDQVLDAES